MQDTNYIVTCRILENVMAGDDDLYFKKLKRHATNVLIYIFLDKSISIIKCDQKL